MRIEATDQWMLEETDPLKLCKKLEPFFEPFAFDAIHQHLYRHGMYQKTDQLEDHKNRIRLLQKKEIWKEMDKEACKLQKKWNGPHIPIFIFLSDHRNKMMKEKLKGRSGIAFKDKLILFITESNSPDDLRTLLAHEYHHTVRLHKLTKPETKFTLLDSIIMEGLAENAVREQYGSTKTAYWTSLYDEETLSNIWKQFIQPKLHLKKSNPKHALLLHGHKQFPEMAGYCCGYQLVQNYMIQNDVSTDQLLDVPAAQFLPKKESVHPFFSFFNQDSEKA